MIEMILKFWPVGSFLSGDNCSSEFPQSSWC